MNNNYKPYEIYINIPNDFKVLKFVGEEEFNKPYQYVIDVISSRSDIDLDSILLKEIVLKMHSSVDKNELYCISGICKCIKTKNFFLGNKYVYEITLVPKLWNLSLSHSSKIYIDITINNIIRECMKINDLIPGQDYEINLTEDYSNLEFVCQYNESVLDFLTRWIEVYGIYYYFEHTINGDKLIFTDKNSTLCAIKNKDLEHANIQHINNKKEDKIISEFNLTSIQRNTFFQHDHYDGTRKLLDNTAATVETCDDKTFRLYGGNPQIRDSFNNFDVLEQERLDANKCLGQGKSTVICMCVGGVFDLSSNFQANNGSYLITKVQHSGNQSQFLLEKSATLDDKLYENSFEVISYSTQYRPQKITPKPYFNGLINGTIDGIAKDKPLVDKMGRYKVLLPFDTLSKEDGKASVYVRVVQQSASNENSGMHFRLLKGDEVILGFREGDVDRPVILGAVNNKSKIYDVENIIDKHADFIRRKNTVIGLDDNVLFIQTPQKIEIIG